MGKILIIGCGRSGTRYCSKVLKNCGLDIGHERKAGEDGMTSWMSIAKPEELESYEFVYHQVREPLGVISSFKTVMRRTWRTICEVETRIDDENDSLLLKSMKYWLYWNQRCEKKASMTYRVESIFVNALPTILSNVDIELTKEMSDKALAVPTNDHTRVEGHAVSDTYEAVTWDDLECEDAELCMQIRDQAIRYGYDV